MTTLSSARDLSQIEIAMDQWTEPFWKAGEEGRLVLCRCGNCGDFRWPPGPFCPSCNDQAVEWVEPGQGLLFSYTIVPGKPEKQGEAAPLHVVALIQFPDAGGMRILGSLIDAPIDQIRIDAPVEARWVDAVNTRVPVFRLAAS